MVNVLVVEEDVDIRDPVALECVVAFRVNAAEGQLLSCGPTSGSVLAPAMRRAAEDA